MTPHHFTLCFVLFATAAAHAQDMALPNPGFEDGLKQWTTPKVDHGMSQSSAGAAHSGKLGLLVNDQDEKKGSEIFSTRLEAIPGKEYQLRFWAKIAEGEGVAVYLAFADEENKSMLNGAKGDFLNIPAGAAEWKEYTLNGVAPAGTRTVAARIHSFTGTKVQAQFDDFALSALQ